MFALSAPLSIICSIKSALAKLAQTARFNIIDWDEIAQISQHGDETTQGDTTEQGWTKAEVQQWWKHKHDINH